MRNLALVDQALERAREKTAQMLAAPRRRRAARRRYPRLHPERRRSKLARALERLRTERLLKAWRRDARMSRARGEIQRSVDSRGFDAFTAGLWAESKAQRYQTDVRVRALLAEKLRAVAARFDRDDVLTRAVKLEEAGREGWWGVRGELDGSTPPDKSSIVIRLRDRSGLIMLDPADSRERTAELIERLIPLLLVCAKQGYELHKFVVTEPNVPAGALAWGKEQLFRHFMRTVLERDGSGQEIPRTRAVRHAGKVFDVDNPARRFPEIVGAIAIQEDPLARDGHHWNQHLNVVLVIDPGQCTPLDRELWPTDPETGDTKPDPAAARPGMFSYMKLRHVWGHEVEGRLIRGEASELRDALLEVFKYACKTVSEKSLRKFESSRAGRGADPASAGAEPSGYAPADSSEPPAPALGVGHQSEPPTRDQAPALELVGELEEPDPAAPRAPAPAMIDWPDERVLEWLDANKGFRRVRAWGCLYRLGKLPRATDPDEGITWLGRISITPWTLTVQLNFFGEGNRVSSVASIRENKSRPTGQGYRAQAPP